MSDDAPVAVAAGDTTRTRCLKHLLAAMTLAGDGAWGGAAAALRPALAIGPEVEDLDLLGNLGNAALNVGDDEAARRFYTQMLTGARVRGAGMSAVYALQRLAFPQLLAGQWTALRSSADEALTLARSVGQRALTAAPLAWLTLLAALQGTADYENLLADLEEVVATHRLGILTDPVHDLTRWAKAARATDHGDTSAALHHLSQMRLPVLTRMAAPDRVDTAVRAGDAAQAAAWTARTGTVRRGDPVALGAGLGGLRTSHDRRPADAPACSRPRWLTTGARTGPTNRPAPSLPTGSSCAAPIAASTPAPTCARHWRPSTDLNARPRWSPAPPRSYALQARRPANVTSSTLLAADARGAEGRTSSSPRACRTRTSPPSAGSRPGQSRSTCATSSQRLASAHAANSPSSTS